MKTNRYIKDQLPFRTRAVHLDNNGLVACGMSSQKHIQILTSKNPKDVTCFRCKKTYSYPIELLRG